MGQGHKDVCDRRRDSSSLQDLTVFVDCFKDSILAVSNPTSSDIILIMLSGRAETKNMIRMGTNVSSSVAGIYSNRFVTPPGPVGTFTGRLLGHYG